MTDAMTDARPSPRVLIVEDNEMNRDMLSRRLARHGFRTLVAVNGHDGIAAARAERPDLILMDVQLPDLNGLAATAAIKADPATAGIPVIALTAEALSGDREKGLAAGCDEYETKPVELPRLLAKMRALLAGPADAGQSVR